MALNERDHVLLREIERRLSDADPALEELFDRWPAAGPDLPSRWVRVPLWALVVFVCAFVGWTLSPPMGAITLILCVVLAVARAQATPPAGSRPDGG